MGVNRSSYQYHCKTRGKKLKQQAHDEATVREAFEASKGAAGSRTIVKLVKNQGQTIARSKARKIMAKLNLVSCQAPRKRKRPDNTESRIQPNILQRDFTPQGPNLSWCTDVTQFVANGRPAYLAVVLDLYSRKAIGWQLSLHPDTTLTKNALKMALRLRGYPKNLVLHSDQGSHFSSKEYQDYLANYGVQGSMSRKGNCWDNAVMERFFRSIKTERIGKKNYQSLQAASSDVSNYILEYYNNIRPHTHNSDRSPNEQENFFYKNL